jgi:nucleoid-associated protein YgaU
MSRPAGQVPRRRLTRLLRGIGALIVLVAIVGGVPLLTDGLHLLPHGVPSLHQIKHDLTSRDNGQFALVVIAVGVWICWALFVLSLIPEIVAAAQKRPAVPLPGLGGFQRPAGALVAAIAIGFAIAPLITGLGSRASAAPPPLPGSGHRSAAATVTAPHLTSPGWDGSGARPTGISGERPTATDPSAAPATHHPIYEVQRRDTLWQIAEDHLGDPMRYTEIVALNQHMVGPDNLIVAGMRLVMPSDATGLAPSAHDRAGTDSVRVRVQPGDTLSGLEERVTGSADWQPGWEANQGRVEPGGEHFDDPDLIKPGWVLEIPPASPTETPTVPRTRQTPTHQTPAQPRHQPTHPAPPQRAHPERPGGRSATPAHSASTAPSRAGHRPGQADTQQAPAAASEDGYVALTIGGGLLAATTFATLMVLRRRKFRHRRPGHVVASLPPDLVPLEQALVSAGRPALAKMTFLDLALRDLANRIGAQPDGQLPDIAGAAINDDYLELYMVCDNPPPAPPAPWLQSDPLRWTLGRDADLDPAAADRLAPYPCLVSVGYSEDGTEYLLDLEHAGALQLAGDPGRCLDLARYMVAELANNMWSDHLTVTVAGFGAELVDANPTRLAHTDDPHAAAAAVARVASENRNVAGEAGIDVLVGRLRGTDGDVWMPHVLLAAPGVDHNDVELLRGTATGGRAAVAVVLTGGRSDDGHLESPPDDATMGEGPRIQVTANGALMTSLLPAGDMLALGLPEADAPDLARAIALDRDGTLDEPTPRSTGQRPWDTFADAAGALLPEYTVPRTASGPAAIDPQQPVSSSLLPGPDETYVAAAATTEEDLAELAPAVTVETRAAVEHANPDLDELVAAWRNPDARLAKLQLLGPVTVTAYGRPPVKQEDFCTEIVAYLWHKPHGVSTDEFANELWPNKDYSGTDSYPKDMASRTRQWLGVDPRAGKEYWPRARRDGVQGYRLDGLLCDVDLFRRLRARGEARGADGLPDLVAALDLVSGTPLSRLRPFGYGWLPAGDELLYQGAVAEVAHLVATHALAAGDDSEALRACELALEFNREDDWALLQMTKAHERAGRDAEKEATILRLRTLEDPPARTLEVMRRNGWLSRGA